VLSVALCYRQDVPGDKEVDPDDDCASPPFEELAALRLAGPTSH
jgi:hypothetical protein